MTTPAQPALLMIELARLRNINADLLAMLEEASEYLKDRMDVVDGDYGEPKANRAMRLHIDVERVIEWAKAKSA